jgi:dihydrofolate synthase/folylpolyglutamate synthase
LGDTIEKIAGEKAAIIKPGSKAVFAHDLKAGEVFERQALAVDSPFVYANPFIINEFVDSLDHLPGYQRSNAATALTAVASALGHPIARNAGLEAFAHVVIPGRFERLSTDPLVIIDAAHNPQSAETLATELSRRFIVATLPESLAQINRTAGKVEVPTLLLGVLADKDVRGVIRALCPLFFRVVVTASSSPRSISAGRLAAIVEEETGKRPEVSSTIRDAMQLLTGESFIATGSITVAGEVKGIW